MKKWKKSGRKRKKKVFRIDIHFGPDRYVEINKYRIKHNYSWDKLFEVAIKEAVELYKEIGI